MFAVIFIIFRGDYCGQALCENCVSRNFVGTSRKFWTFEHDGHLIDDAHSAVVSGGTEADINCYSQLLLLLLLLFTATATTATATSATAAATTATTATTTTHRIRSSS